jgi:hypothetical protein
MNQNREINLTHHSAHAFARNQSKFRLISAQRRFRKTVVSQHSPEHTLESDLLDLKIAESFSSNRTYLEYILFTVNQTRYGCVHLRFPFARKRFQTGHTDSPRRQQNRNMFSRLKSATSIHSPFSLRFLRIFCVSTTRPTTVCSSIRGSFSTQISPIGIAQ